jgi:hypothetical protein
MTEAEWLACEDLAAMLDFLEERASDRKLRLFACACCRVYWMHQDQASWRVVEEAERLADGLMLKHGLFDSRDPLHGGANRAALSTATGPAIIAARQVAEDMVETAAEHADYDFETSIHEAVDAAIGKDAWDTLSAADQDAAVEAAVSAAGGDVAREAVKEAAREAARDKQLSLLREIFGNPFRLSRAIPTSGQPETISELARIAYDLRLLPSGYKPTRTWDAVAPGPGHLDAQRLYVLADALEQAGYTGSDILVHLRSPDPHVRGCWALDLILGRS